MCIFSTSITIGAVTISAAVANAIAAASAVAVAASTALGTIGSIQQGKQQQAMADYQANVAKENAKIAQNNADTERQTGIEEARLQRMKTLQAVGAQQAAMAANGMDVTSGTSLDIIQDTSAMGELDALQIQTNYERRALAYEQQANNFNNEAQMDTIAGKNAYSAGIINGVSNGLNGIGKVVGVADKWLGFSDSFGGNGNKNSGMYIPKERKKFNTRVSGGIAGDDIMFG